ncbi:hypothetical protein ACOME3_004166 [Neoechinorhynchus agilis]
MSLTGTKMDDRSIGIASALRLFMTCSIPVTCKSGTISTLATASIPSLFEAVELSRDNGGRLLYAHFANIHGTYKCSPERSFDINFILYVKLTHEKLTNKLETVESYYFRRTIFVLVFGLYLLVKCKFSRDASEENTLKPKSTRNRRCIVSNITGNYASRINCRPYGRGQSLPNVLRIVGKEGTINRVFIEKVSIDEFPNDLEFILPNVEDMSIFCRKSTDKVFKIDKYMIQNFKHLKKLFIQYADLYEIEDDSFKGFNDLTHLNLMRNKIMVLDSTMGNHLLQLKFLILSNNRLGGDCLSIINRIINLKVLDLSNNQMEVVLIPDACRFDKLVELRMENNPLRRIQLDRLTQLEDLKILAFSFIGELNDLFRGETIFCSLEEFIVSGGTTKSLNTSFLRKIPKLTRLEFNKACLEEVPAGNERTSKLMESMLLSRNRIRKLDDSCFSQWSNLDHLDLSRNRISSISKYAFSHLRRLRILNLSSNQISYLFQELLKKNVQITKLLLANNDLITLPEHFLKTLKNLQMLDLSNNPLSVIDTITVGANNVRQCIVKNTPISLLLYDAKRNTDTFLEIFDVVEFMPQPSREAFGVQDMARHLNITINVTVLTSKNLHHIKDVHQLINGNETFSLDLSHNKISVIDNDDFLLLTNLRFLCVQFNKIWKIVPRSFEYCQELKTLDLANNHLRNLDVQDMFYGLNNVIFLHLAKNGFRLFPRSHLSNLKSLRSLNISHNPIREFYSGAFREAGTVTEVDVTFTDIKSILDL